MAQGRVFQQGGQMRSESRKATDLQRIYPTTRQRLVRHAKDRGMSVPALLDELVPHVRRSMETGECRYCDRSMKNPRGRHGEHDPRCVLYV